MFANGVILQKLQQLEEVLGELRSLGPVSASGLEGDWKTRRAIERDLQILVEVVIDVCQRLISLAGEVPAAAGADAVERCVKLGVLACAEPYRRMVQFRNFVVHRYDRVDPEILVEIVNRRLEDFDRFRGEVLSYVRG